MAAKAYENCPEEAGRCIEAGKIGRRKGCRQALEELVPMLLKIYADPSIRIILYGSVARGTDTEESDIDIAVITENHTRNTFKEMVRVAADLNLEYDVVLSVHPIDAEKFAE